MSRKLVFLGLLSLILAPGAALSLGLGDIRLNSYLNQPMNAEIALSLASRDELDALRVELASADAFSRYGLDRPAYLDDLRFVVRPTGPASAVVQVTSSRPIVEPFVTFLVEARWSGGRILREYTVLLDPPVFLPRPEAAPVAAPAPSGAPAVGQPRAAPEPAPVDRPTAIAPEVAPPVRGEFGDEFGPVRRNDTLWSIAQRVRPDPSLTTNQVMVALFRANPGAFDGNINRLRAGAILRVPSRDQFVATSAGEANAEVRRHNEDWRGSVPAAAAPTERRLELAPPTEAPRPTAPAADPGAATASRELLDAVQDLRGELAETRRLMDIKDAEIAALQARLAELESDDVAVAPAPAVDAPAPAEAEPVAETPTPAEPAPVAAPEPAPRAVVSAPPPPSFLDRVLGLLGSIWLWLAIALALVAAAVIVFLRKRKEEEERSIEDDLAATGRWNTLETPDGKAAVAAAVAAAAAPAAAAAEARRLSREEGASILVEETRREPSQRDVPPAPVAPVSPPPSTEADEDDYRYPFEDTIAGEAGINLDQTDPLAEADFHMAYGLYDQAAEIVKKAIEREPDRYDLRRKLVDICFVWGNAREFLAQANAMREMPGEAPSGDWAKIAIMGRQICPGEPLFEGGEAAAVDMDLGDDQAPAPDIGASGSWLDFDVGESEAPLEALGDTREQPSLDSPAAVRSDMTAELDLEELGIDLDLGESGEHALKDLADFAPETAPESGLGMAEDWLPEPADEIDEEADESHTGTLRLDTPPVITGLPREPAEPAPDGGTMMMDMSQFKRTPDDPTERGEGFSLSEDEPTLAGIEGFEEEEDSDLTQVKSFNLPDEMPTTEVDTLEEELDLDLDDLTQMLEAGGGSSTKEYDATRIATSESEAPFTVTDEVETREVPPVELNEVGTKLDLARAYIDMGDPDGARSILEEVVAEGDEAQRDEARELLESLS